jgi:hypothetical protein
MNGARGELLAQFFVNIYGRVTFQRGCYGSSHVDGEVVDQEVDCLRGTEQHNLSATVRKIGCTHLYAFI